MGGTVIPSAPPVKEGNLSAIRKTAMPKERVPMAMA